MMHLCFVVPGEAVGKQEKASTRRTALGKAVGYIYTLTKSRVYMKLVAQCAREAIQDQKTPGLPSDDALAIEIVSFFPRPKSVSKSRKYPINRVDCTNIQKGIEDALHKPDPIAFRNDCHVVSIKTDKRYCLPNQEPHTRVEVWTAGQRPVSFARARYPRRSEEE